MDIQRVKVNFKFYEKHSFEDIDEKAAPILMAVIHCAVSAMRTRTMSGYLFPLVATDKIFTQ